MYLITLSEVHLETELGRGVSKDIGVMYPWPCSLGLSSSVSLSSLPECHHAMHQARRRIALPRKPGSIGTLCKWFCLVIPYRVNLKTYPSFSPVRTGTNRALHISGIGFSSRRLRPRPSPIVRVNCWTHVGRFFAAHEYTVYTWLANKRVSFHI